jgi:hypothetical protein
MSKKVHVLGGGTFSYVRNHLALSAPAFGQTARILYNMSIKRFPVEMDVELHLTKMASPLENDIVTNEDVLKLVQELKSDLDTKVIFFNVALCDYNGQITTEQTDGKMSNFWISSGKYAKRLSTSEGIQTMELKPAEKILKKIREGRKDIFLVAFKTTCGANQQEQYLAGLDLLKRGSCNLVLANDTKTRLNMIITPEEARYHVLYDREEVLRQLVDMTFYRSQLSFTKSTVVDGTPVPWSSNLVFESLRKVVNYCIGKGAYKPFNGATVGHFACKLSDNEFLTSIRKSNFNDLEKNGLVRITTDGNDTVLAYGAKPSVGGQSQRIIFSEHKDKEYDCIVHFHCPQKGSSEVPVVSQREYECGSHQCGQNTSRGLKQFGNLSAVMLDNHGPNIVFNHKIDPQEVINFIEENFHLEDKTGGLVS